VQYFVDNVMNPCQASTFTFLETVIDYLQSKHAKFDNYHKIIHMGGDEVPHRDWAGNEKSTWAESPACQNLLEANKLLDSPTWQNLQPTEYRLWWHIYRILNIFRNIISNRK